VATGVTVPGLPRFETPSCCQGSIGLALVAVELVPVATFALLGVVTIGIELGFPRFETPSCCHASVGVKLAVELLVLFGPRVVTGVTEFGLPRFETPSWLKSLDELVPDVKPVFAFGLPDVLLVAPALLVEVGRPRL